MSVAACPLILKRTDGERSLCDDVRCTECDLLHAFLEEAGEVEWVCSACLGGDEQPLGFQTAGGCDRCGRTCLFRMPVAS